MEYNHYDNDTDDYYDDDSDTLIMDLSYIYDKSYDSEEENESSTSINKLQVMQNAALRTATGCTQDTNIQHLHDETLTLPIHEHLQLHASQYKQKTQHPSHPLHKHTTYFNTPRLKKTTIFNNGRYTTNIPTDSHTVTTTDIKTNMRHIHIYCL